MKTFSTAVFVVSMMMMTASAAWAQAPRNEKHAEEQPAHVSPEMWLYQQQLERYDDPQTAVRRNAEMRAAQRHARIAALKWYGYSNSRPTANPTPWGSPYSPAWTSNSIRPYSWVGARPATTVIIEQDKTYQR